MDRHGLEEYSTERPLGRFLFAKNIYLDFIFVLVNCCDLNCILRIKMKLLTFIVEWYIIHLQSKKSFYALLFFNDYQIKEKEIKK
ncbi:hypothetical protein D3C73_872940 [compost metagenome]